MHGLSRLSMEHLSFRLGLMSAAVQLTEMQLIKKLTYKYVRQTHGSNRAALTVALDIISLCTALFVCVLCVRLYNGGKLSLVFEYSSSVTQ